MFGKKRWVEIEALDKPTKISIQVDSIVVIIETPEGCDIGLGTTAMIRTKANYLELISELSA